jgi:uncharacterized membrane protein
VGANASFSVFAGTGSLLIAILSAAAGAWPVTVVFGMLAIGFLARATERYWRRDD